MFLFFNKINKLGLWVGVGWSEVVRGAKWGQGSLDRTFLFTLYFQSN